MSRDPPPQIPHRLCHCVSNQIKSEKTKQKKNYMLVITMIGDTCNTNKLSTWETDCMDNIDFFQYQFILCYL